ncbi:MAG TPA: AMP-binding protein [bacterium]|nr:AMP-binding protein [bacterium]
MNRSAGRAFREARDFLIARREDYEAAYQGFMPPEPSHFNWALDYFGGYAEGNHRAALRIVSESAPEEALTFAELSERSNRVANFLRGRGVRRGDRILLMLGNVVPLWEVTLAAMKLGAVVSPATTLLNRADLEDRIARGGLGHLVVDAAAAERLGGFPGPGTRIAVGGAVAGWTPYADVYAAPARFAPDGETRASDLLLLYFTSGTTAKPKMAMHTHRSYPVGHLSTMYWLGLREGDVHYNISSPGWAKHAWSSLFAPWNAGATIFVYNQPRFDAKQILGAVARGGVTSLCAPPTVWRMLILEDLPAYPVRLREVASAGEPLNPEVIEQVRAAWNLTIRDGYGQTETTALVGNTPGQPVKLGSMGRPLPGYRLALLDAAGQPADEGQISVALRPRPVGLMEGYLGGPEADAARAGDYYLTGDVASRDGDGYFWYVGRADDVFKSSDYRISPFELESALIEHAAVAEAAVVPSPDAIRLSVPKAFLVLKPGVEPTEETARAIFTFARERLAPYKRIRRLEFCELPKTISGKIRRIELREREQARHEEKRRGVQEFWEEDFVEFSR